MAELLCSPDLFAATAAPEPQACGDAFGCSLCARGARRAMLPGQRRRILGWGMEDRCDLDEHGQAAVRRVIVDPAEFAAHRDRAAKLLGCNARHPAERLVDAG